jgi:predicted  nucleic acid-binding Zn-ribbon protein
MERLTSFSDLLELQQVDSLIDKLREDRRTLSERAQLREAAREAAAAAAAYSDVNDRLRAVERSTARVEDELTMTEQRVREQERRLFAGAMSAREADHLRQEVGNLHNRVSVMEDELLELLEERERLDAEEEGARETAAEASGVERRLAARVAELEATIDASLVRYLQRRAEIAADIDPVLVRKYVQLRKRRGGVVVGEVDGRVCGACHLQMSAAEYEEVAADRIPQCIHCAAILCL